MAAESELPSDDGYVLQRGFAASARQVYILMADKSTVNLLMVVLIRLNLMHYLWRDQLGYLVHPRIPITKANLAVADIGTGTGYCSGSFYLRRDRLKDLLGCGYLIWDVLCHPQRNCMDSTYHLINARRRNGCHRTFLSLFLISTKMFQRISRKSST